MTIKPLPPISSLSIQSRLFCLKWVLQECYYLNGYLRPDIGQFPDTQGIKLPHFELRETIAAEIEKWDHLNGLTYSVALGDEIQRSCSFKEAQVYIINRENVD